MRKTILLVSLAFTMSFIGKAQQIIENFEASLPNKSVMNGFSGGTPSVVANPSKSGINRSDSVGMLTIDAVRDPWAGFWVNRGDAVDSTSKWINANENHYVHVMVYKPFKSNLKFKLEGSYSGTVEKYATTPDSGKNTKINEWEDIVIDFSEVKGYVHVWVLTPDWDRTGSGVVYFDNIVINNDPDPITAKDAQVIENFEGPAANKSVMNGFSGGTPSIVANPSKAGINKSDSVGMLTIDAVRDPWAGFWVNRGDAVDSAAKWIDANDNHYVHVMVYKSFVSNLKFKLEGSYSGTVEKYATIPDSGKNSKINEWQDIVIDFSEVKGFVHVWVLTPDWDRTGAGVVYFDNVVINNDPWPVGYKKLGVVEDFETPEDTLKMNLMAGGVDDSSAFTVMENPFKTGINKSDIVCQLHRDKDGVPWEGFWSPTEVDVTNNKFVHVKVYKPRISTVKFKLEGGAGGNLEIASMYPQTKVNDWEDVVFDFRSKTGKIPVIALMPDFNDPVGLDADIDIYFDDIVINNDSLPFGYRMPGLVEDFETPEDTLKMNLMAGGADDSSAFTVLDNPFKTGINMSEMVCQLHRDKDGVPWEGFWSPTEVDVTQFKFVHVKVYKPRISTVKFKLEGGAGGNLEIESKYPQTKVNEWEDMVFDFRSKTGKIPVIAFMPDFNDPVGLDADIDIYFDDIVINNDSLPFGYVKPFDSLIENFETPADTLKMNLMAGGADDLSGFTVINNPFKTGINTSNKVCQLLRDKDGVPWEGFWSPTKIDVTNNKFVHVKVYKPRISEVKFKLEGGEGGNIEIPSKYAQTKVNEWEDMVFDFREKTGIIPVIAFMPDFSDPVGLDADINIYFDDIMLSNDSVPVGGFPDKIENAVNTPSIVMYPNPVDDNLRIDNALGMSKVIVSNIYGQRLRSYAVNASTLVVPFNNLKAGLYIVTVVGNNGYAATRKVIKR